MTKRSGGCACGALRYEAAGDPLVVHCCHCGFCQRETGTAFATNYLIEADRVTMTGPSETVVTPSASGKGQKIVRCPTCHVAVSSHYGGGGEAIHFLRVGTMDEPSDIAPDIHIYTAARQPWVVLPEGALAFEGFYDPREVWSDEQRARWTAATAR